MLDKKENELVTEGKSYLHKHKHEEAIKSFNAAIKINPKSLNAWAYKGEVYDYIGKYNESNKCFNKAIKIKAVDADTWYFKGLSFYRLGKYYKSIKCFDEAIKIEPYTTYPGWKYSAIVTLTNSWRSKGQHTLNLEIT